ncbi:MAG TPA: ferritin-like domain-containing protein [candidate division Zixibacteria bacterium]|nr:ferritin-like domain-containing protein [candidate division Zixibacteria bacterium]
MDDIAVLFGLETATGQRGELSPIERLLNEFETHESREEASISHYKKILAMAPNPVIKFILQLIISDEEKHRAVIHAMINTLRGSMLWSKPEGALDGVADLGELNHQLRSVTEDLIALEKEGVRECKALVKESSGYYYGIFKILLESMIRDSEKHIELLEFLRERMGEA